MPYTNEFHREVIRRAVHYMAFFGGGDVIAQVFAAHRETAIADAKNSDFTGPSQRGSQVMRAVQTDFEYLRVVRSAFFGAFVFSPLRYRYAGSLERMLPFPHGVSQTSPIYHEVVLKRFGIEHILWSPSCAGLYIVTATAATADFTGIPYAIRDAFAPSVFGTWGLWIPAQLLLYAAFPRWLWVPTTNVLLTLWAAWLSHCLERKRRF